MTEDVVSGAGQMFTISTKDRLTSGKIARASGTAGEARPVILALHGGTYNADYFDVPGYSLLDRGAAQGFDVIAPDRPGYRGSTPLADAPDLIARNAAALNDAIPVLLRELGVEGRPVFLIGHSIGGAIALTLAGIHQGWRLVGLAISGVGAKTPPESAAAYATLPPDYFVELPAEAKDSVMFGPRSTLNDDMPRASHVAHTRVPRSELTDIPGGWQDRLVSVAEKVTVPVHYRQGGHEKLWLTDAGRVAAFGRLFTRSPRVDAALVPDVGHCIDFHRGGAAFQDEQLAFARGSVDPADEGRGGAGG